MYLVYDYNSDQLLTPQPVDEDQGIKLLKMYSVTRPTHFIGMSVNPFRTAPTIIYYDGYLYRQEESK